MSEPFGPGIPLGVRALQERDFDLSSVTKDHGAAMPESQAVGNSGSGLF